MRALGSAIIAFHILPAGAAMAAAPDMTVAVSSNDRVGLSVTKRARGASVSAALGMWSDDGALELGGFQDRADPAIARAAELVSGKPMQSRGVRLSGTLGGQRARGWALGVEARRQQVTDIGAALSGGWRRSSDSRLSVSGKLKF
jgi:hypothetical protein